MTNQKHIIIIGAGFAGMYAAKQLLVSRYDSKITILDARNFHLFQPLLYQVATAQLSPEDISYPIRSIFKKYKNITVLNENVSYVNLDNKYVKVDCGNLYYDKLIISVGVSPNYFKNSTWAEIAPSLKTLEDALIIRKKILRVFEKAESESLHPCDETNLNFVIIGGGPTGVELSGAIAELSRSTLKNDFRNVAPYRAKIILIEAGSFILNGFPYKLKLKAVKSLEKLGIIIKTNSFVTKIESGIVQITANGSTEEIKSEVVIWAAGVKAYFGNNILSTSKSINYDKIGRVVVNKDLTVPDFEDVYVIGDFSSCLDKNQEQLPGTAPVAMQQGKYAAKHIAGKITSPFKYLNKGNLAVIGRNAAVADFGSIQFSGYFAWLLWAFVHIGYLIGFSNKLTVFIKWAWNYIRRKSTARIIYTTKNGN